MFTNTIGNHNTATGPNTLLRNTTGLRNTANGASALNSNTTGSSNIAVGDSAGLNLTSGSNNIDIGAPGVAGESGKIPDRQVIDCDWDFHRRHLGQNGGQRSGGDH